MTINERIFDLLKKKGISQKDFSIETGISPSTISDWKKKGTNPASDKILVICDVLNVSPYYLLSGVERTGTLKNKDCIVIDKKSEEGFVIEQYANLNADMRKRLMGYLDALSE